MASKKKFSDKRVEIIPGIMVSQALIDEAVFATTDPKAVERIEEKQLRKKMQDQEVRDDIAASRDVLQAMFNRTKEPLDPNERYVSYDAMPAPLQRVVKAYIDAVAAQKELDEAIKALQTSAQTPIAA